MVKNERKLYSLGEICEKIVGGGTPSKSVPSYWNGEIYRATVKDMPSSTYRLYTTQDKITEEGLQNSSSRLVSKGTLIISARMGVGRCFLAMNDMAINQDMKAIYVKKEFVSSEFLLRWYVSNSKQIESLGSGTTVKGITLDQIKNLEILLPPLPTQQRIASILSNYDDLIENNNHRIQILEEQAQSLYRHWFVDFKFPGQENVKMVESGTEFGMIPEGWEVKAIKQFGDVITGKTPSTKKSEYWGTDMMFIKTPDMHGSVYCLETSTYLSKIGSLSQKNKTLPKNSILVSCIGTLGVISITSEESQFNQQINAIIPSKEYYIEYLYLNMKMQKQQLENLGSNGATMGNVNKDKFEKMNIICPNESLLINFHHYVANLFEEILLLQKQNTNLKKQRDLLLPKLMSGEILVD